MKSLLLMLASSGLVFVVGCSNGEAQEDDDGAAPVHIYTCKYNEGKGPTDLDKVVARWNAWADEREIGIVVGICGICYAVCCKIPTILLGSPGLSSG